MREQRDPGQGEPTNGGPERGSSGQDGPPQAPASSRTSRESSAPSRPSPPGPPSRPSPPSPPNRPAPTRRFFPWALPPERDQPAREALTRDQIIEAAIRLLDAEGLGALSMRRLGQELGAGATSLYWHIRNKDELLDLALDRIIGEVIAEVPEETGEWRPLMAEAARAFRRVLLRHRNVTPIMGARPTLGPNSLEGMDRLVRSFRDVGFPLRRAYLAANTVVNWAAGFTVFECRNPLGPTATPEEQAGYLQDFNLFLASLPPDRFPTMVEMAPLATEITADAQFEYGLERLLDGIEAEQVRLGSTE